MGYDLGGAREFYEMEYWFMTIVYNCICQLIQFQMLIFNFKQTHYKIYVNILFLVPLVIGIYSGVYGFEKLMAIPVSNIVPITVMIIFFGVFCF